MKISQKCIYIYIYLVKSKRMIVPLIIQSSRTISTRKPWILLSSKAILFITLRCPSVHQKFPHHLQLHLLLCHQLLLVAGTGKLVLQNLGKKLSFKLVVETRKKNQLAYMSLHLSSLQFCITESSLSANSFLFFIFYLNFFCVCI